MIFRITDLFGLGRLRFSNPWIFYCRKASSHAPLNWALATSLRFSILTPTKASSSSASSPLYWFYPKSWLAGIHRTLPHRSYSYCGPGGLILLPTLMNAYVRSPMPQIACWRTYTDAALFRIRLTCVYRGVLSTIDSRWCAVSAYLLSTGAIYTQLARTRLTHTQLTHTHTPSTPQGNVWGDSLEVVRCQASPSSSQKRASLSISPVSSPASSAQGAQ